MKKKQLIKELEQEIERLKLVQKIWFLKGVPECAHNLEWKIFGIEFSLQKIKQ